MILQLVSADQKLAQGLRTRLRSLGLSLVHYWDPIKAMDNFLETSPDIILYSLQDFPRHWKIMIRFLGEEKALDDKVFLLFTAQSPDLEEADKAAFLGVNGIIHTQGTPEDLARQVRDIYSRYGAFERDGKPVWIWRSSEVPLGFLFRHPEKNFLVPGRLIRLEQTRGIFRPENRHDILDITPGTNLGTCSLFLQGKTLELQAKAVGNTGQLALDFLGLNPQVQSTLEDFLAELSLD